MKTNVKSLFLVFTLLSLTLFMFACNKGSADKKGQDTKKEVKADPKKKEVMKKPEAKEKPDMAQATLESKIGALNKALVKMFTKEMGAEKVKMAFADFDKGIEYIASLKLAEKAKKTGDKAPDFDLKNATGKNVKLSELLKKGPVVLTWYRGGWCPYCSLQLKVYQENLAEFKKLGGQLVAISPEVPDKSLTTKEKKKLTFEVVSDTDNKTAKAYGLVYTVPPYVLKHLKGMKIDLKAYNGNDKNELPIAVTYVISKDGTISYSFLHADYKKRAEPKAIIEALKKLKEKA